MDRVARVIDVIIDGLRTVDRQLAKATIEQARQATLAAERRRHPSTGGVNLGLDEFVPSRRPVHRHIRAG